MKHFALSVVHTVPDLAKAIRFLQRLPGFDLDIDEAERPLLHNGSISIALEQAEQGTQNSLLTVALSVNDLDASANELIKLDGVCIASAAHLRSTRLLEQTLDAPHNLRLLLQRRFNEDELDEEIPLPTSLDWNPEAHSFGRKLVNAVPHQVRDLARNRMVNKAEELTIERGDVTVLLPEVLRSMVLGTPSFQMLSLWMLMKSLDLDPSIPFSGFESYLQE
ncbi:MAG: DUF2621 family protein [Mariprofundales bacterium]